MAHVVRKTRFRLTKKQLAAVETTVSRWGATIFDGRPTDMGRIEQLARAAYNSVKCVKTWTQGKRLVHGLERLHVVHSPIAFYIAQGVIRGLLKKELAVDALKSYGVNTDFLKDLRRDSLLHLKTCGYRYGGDSLPLSDVWRNFSPVIKAASMRVFSMPSQNIDSDNPNLSDYQKELLADNAIDFTKRLPAMRKNYQTPDVLAFQNNNVTSTVRTRWEDPTRSIGVFARETDAALTSATIVKSGLHYPVIDRISYTSQSSDAILSRSEAVPENTQGYLRYDYMDAELMSRLLGLKSDAHIWPIELMHEASAFMSFRNSALVLVGRPECKFNADGELHSSTGPAIKWADGASVYYNNGHCLDWLGKTIVENPSKLTIEMIQQQPSEEVRRVAIEQLGWDHYLTACGAKVLDSRENWVDNTIEALVVVEEAFMRRHGGGFAPQGVRSKKLILSCRSTGRKYFLTVPQEIETCEQGQVWMAGGATTRNVPQFKPMRVIGAS